MAKASRVAARTASTLDDLVNEIATLAEQVARLEAKIDCLLPSDETTEGAATNAAPSAKRRRSKQAEEAQDGDS